MNLDKLRHIIRMNVGENCALPDCLACIRGRREQEALLAAIDVAEAAVNARLALASEARETLREKLENLK